MRRQRDAPSERCRASNPRRPKTARPPPPLDTTGDAERELHRRVFETTGDGLLVADVETKRIVLANPAASRMLGCTADEITSLSVMDVHTPHDLERVLALFERLARHELRMAENVPMRRRNGEVFYADINAVPLPLRGRPCLLGVFRDVTTRKQAEEALRASEERYRAFIEQSSEGIWRYELEQPVSISLPFGEQVELAYQHAYLAECNDAMARMYGFSRAADILGARLGDLMPRSDPKNLELLRALLQSDYRLVDVESHEVAKDSQVKCFLNNMLSIIEDGKVLRVWGTQRDITERKRAEQTLRESEERYRILFENNPHPMWLVDHGTLRFLAVNDSAARRYGYSREEFLAMTIKDIRLPEDVPAVLDFVSRLTAGYHASPAPYRHRKKDGTVIDVETTGHTFVHAGRLVSLVLASDVTARLRADRERQAIERKLQETQKLESLGVLAGGIAHDFNNLLAAILGNVNLASMQLSQSAAMRPYLTSIEVAAHRAADLCKQMLAYSGKGRFSVQPINVNTIINEMANLLRISIGKDIILKFNLAPSLPLIAADATQVRQVVMNLIINASEAIGGQSGAISLATGVAGVTRAMLAEAYLAPELPEGEYLCLEVADTGCGMDAETKARIFDPFYSTKFTGRGLGLAAVLGIIRGHNGAVRVESTPGRGTTFRVLLPCLGTQLETGERAETPAPRLQGAVLVVEDDETLRTVHARMLEAMGLTPVLAATAAEAGAALRTHADGLSAALLNMTLPDSDGEAVCRELRRVRPELSVVLMSGYEQHDAVARLGGRKATCFLQKPFDAGELYEQLRAFLKEGAPSREPPASS